MGMKSSILAAALVGLLLSAGCEKRCEGAADPHARYNVTVLDFCRAQGQFKCAGVGGSSPRSTGTCSSWDGMGIGALLEIQASGQSSRSDGTCYDVTAEVTSAPSQLTLAGPSTDGNAINQIRGTGAFMYAAESVTAGQCEGALMFGLFDSGGPGGIYTQPLAGNLPPAVLYTLFLPSGGTCQACDDNFAIQLTKE